MKDACKDPNGEGIESADDVLDVPSPTEDQKEIEEVSAYISAEVHVNKQLEVSSGGAGGVPTVNLTMPTQVRGLEKSGFSASLSPDEARELATMLEGRADHAERWQAKRERLKELRE